MVRFLMMLRKAGVEKNGVQAWRFECNDCIDRDWRLDGIGRHLEQTSVLILRVFAVCSECMYESIICSCLRNRNMTAGQLCLNVTKHSLSLTKMSFKAIDFESVETSFRRRGYFQLSHPNKPFPIS